MSVIVTPVIIAPVIIVIRDDGRAAVMTRRIIILQALKDYSWFLQFTWILYRIWIILVVPGIKVGRTVFCFSDIYLQVFKRNILCKLLSRILCKIITHCDTCLIESGEVVVHCASPLNLIFLYAVLRKVTHRELLTVYERYMNIFVLIMVADYSALFIGTALL